jgi:LysM repeat protein
VCAAAALAACGDSSAGGDPLDAGNIPTATLPATLPEPTIIGSGAVQPSGGSTYTIKSGDTLATVAARFGFTIEEIVAENPDVDPRALSVGQVIRLPKLSGTPPPAPTEDPDPEATATAESPAEDTPVPEATSTPASLGQTYVVEAGDIPETIAAKFGITTEALLAANPGIDPRGLQIGQVLIIPPPPAGD